MFTHTVSFTGACLVQAMLLPSVGCGWHCLWLSGAHQCSSRCWAPGCSRAGAVSPAAALQPGTPPPLCCLLHTVGKTSCFKCSKGHMQHITWQKFSNNALLSVCTWDSTRGVKCRLDKAPSGKFGLMCTFCSTEFTVHAKKMEVHIPQLLVLFVLRADVDDNRVNPLP